MNNNNFYLRRYLFLFLLLNISIYSQKYGIDTVIVKSTCPCTFTTNTSINPQVLIDTIIVTDSKRIDIPPLPINGFKSLENLIEYPEIFKRAKIEGVILLEGIINENGTLDSIKTIRDQTCCSAAEETIIKLKSHKFIPANYKKKSISVKVNIPVNFYLNEKITIDYKPINGIT